ncbi:hypothetical protein E3J79_00655 [Candidatus Dependentiae bacterium]|nr:MAG: hypothetical protein E3J79_00655 [Candidatus Dependentiae bacterium]
MKNLILTVLLIPSFVFGTKIDDLEQAIQKTNICKVKNILKSITISQHDQQRLLMLSDDLIKRYRSKYECHFLNFEPLPTILEYSKKEILTLLCGFLLLGTAFHAGAFVGRFEKRIPTFSLDFPTPPPVPTPSFFAASTLFSGIITCSAAVIMHYWNVKKQYDNAIEIKRLINKATIHE